LKGRVIALETDNSEMKEDIKQLLKEVQEVKILLAKNQMQ
jgi:TusA-related sulfurtransferase